MPQSRAGFTLLELSVVITIIALLIGGVLVGRTLIKTAEVDSIIAERTKLNNATIAFKDQYKSFPGDMADAYDFWGTTCGTNATTAGTGCNGNGNGYIGFAEGGENVKAWEHLALSGQIEGRMDGNGTSDGANGIILSASNTVKSGFTNGFWDLTSNPTGIANPVGSVFLRFGGLRSTGQASIYYNQALTHGDAWKLDVKIDDGKANNGRVQGDTTSNCTDSGTDYYKIAASGENTTGDCTLSFMLQQ